jgi:hypothetical protein
MKRLTYEKIDMFKHRGAGKYSSKKRFTEIAQALAAYEDLGTVEEIREKLKLLDMYLETNMNPTMIKVMKEQLCKMVEQEYKESEAERKM